MIPKDAVETRVSFNWADENGILRVVHKKGSRMTLKEAIEDVTVGNEVLNGKRGPVLVDIRESDGIDRDARDYFTSDDVRRHRSAAAMLVGNPISRMIGNFFLGLNKTPMPLRLFTDEGEALAWLRDFIE